MARHKGAEEDSRLALLDAAISLLGEPPKVDVMDNISIEAIVQRADRAKGTFFHFFPTKSLFLEMVCQRLAETTWPQLERALAGPADPIGRLARFLAAFRRRRLTADWQYQALQAALAREGNVRFRELVHRPLGELATPALIDLVEQGNLAGVWQVADPEATVEVLLEMTTAGAERAAQLLRAAGPGSTQAAARRLNATLEGVERVLAAPPRCLPRVQPKQLTATR